VLPRHAVEVEELGELPLGVVGEADGLVWQAVGRPGGPGGAPAGQGQPFPVARVAVRAAALSEAGPGPWGSSVMAASISSTTPPSGTMLSTPWPRRTRSTISPSLRASTDPVPLMTRLAVAMSSPRLPRRYSMARRADC